MPLLSSVMSKNNNSFTFPMLLLDRHYNNFSWKERPNLKLTCSIMGAKGFFSDILNTHLNMASRDISFVGIF